ncbi:hypothetical protein C4544_07360 [candidate division WS5 bacterium]|uniref:Uncharacterized protein n=1 Tax=candidate division WS5 bacterium TaxID=2093353 RepID=A0A419D9X0_9BACT|nr:MAG: hypothetical protein C4544_07360 [candidate division WS5 bacterium]
MKVIKNIAENRDLLAAEKVARLKNLNKENVRLFGRSDLPVDEKIISLVIDALTKLSLVQTILHSEDLLELNGYKLNGTVEVIDEVFNLLDAAVELHTRTH